MPKTMPGPFAEDRAIEACLRECLNDDSFMVWKSLIGDQFRFSYIVGVKKPVSFEKILIIRHIWRAGRNLRFRVVAAGSDQWSLLSWTAATGIWTWTAEGYPRIRGTATLIEMQD